MTNRKVVPYAIALPFEAGLSHMTILCSLSVCHPGRRAKRADPGPKYPGIGNQAEAGVLGSRLSRLTALGRDDKSKGRVICDCPAPKGEGGRPKRGRVGVQYLNDAVRIASRSSFSENR